MHCYPRAKYNKRLESLSPTIAIRFCSGSFVHVGYSLTIRRSNAFAAFCGGHERIEVHQSHNATLGLTVIVYVGFSALNACTDSDCALYQQSPVHTMIHSSLQLARRQG